MEDVVKVCIKVKLVVFSCCNFGCGKVMIVEGVVGIFCVFFGFGVCFVLMILWFVRDGVIKVFMNVFYRNLICEGKNVSEFFDKVVVKLRELVLYKYFKDWVGFVFFGDVVIFY